MSVTSVETPVRVLIIDDNLQNREVAEGHLVGAGYQAIQAEGGEQGLALLEEERPDLVLLDVLMPGMDGFETCRQIRMLPVVGDTPVLFLTALGDLGTHKQALDSGADDFLTKPINRTELLIRVRSLLRIKQIVRRAEAELRRHPRPARRAAGREPAEGGADGADRPRSQEPAVEHPVERAVRARPQGSSASRRAIRWRTSCARRSRWCGW